MRKPKWIAVISTVTLLVLAGWVFRAWNAARRPVVVGQTVSFYGKVVDGDGVPVAGAAVTVKVDWDNSTALAMLDFAADAKLQAQAQTLHLTTDPAGRFSVANAPGDRLEVLEVKAPGYAWLVDYGWVPGSKYAVHQNRLFTFRIYPRYQPDPDRPAVFPVIKVGGTNVQPTSRGGSDRDSGGIVTVNEPWTPLIPSAGPDAPSTPMDVDRRIAKLFSDPPTTHSSKVP